MKQKNKDKERTRPIIIEIIAYILCILLSVMFAYMCTFQSNYIDYEENCYQHRG